MYKTKVTYYKADGKIDYTRESTCPAWFEAMGLEEDFRAMGYPHARFYKAGKDYIVRSETGRKLALVEEL